MPGPGGGGGGHSGGGFHSSGGGGSFSGGGHGGGGGFYGGPRGPYRHGPYHHPHYHYYRPYRPWWVGPHYYYGGYGGYFGAFGLIALFIAILVFGGVILFGTLAVATPAFSGNAEPAAVQVDERSVEDFCDAQYAMNFETSKAYEDNIVLVFFADIENGDSWYYEFWDGNDIRRNAQETLNVSFRNYMQLYLFSSSVSYRYSLANVLPDAIDAMTDSLKGKDVFECAETNRSTKIGCRNDTPLRLDESALNDAIADFTETTGIPLYVVVHDIQDVASYNEKGGLSASELIWVVILSILLIVLLILIIRTFVKNRRFAKNADAGPHGNTGSESGKNDNYWGRNDNQW